MSTNTNEMEMLRKAIRLLHSPHPNSATELRMMLDELIKQRYGPEMMISHNMSKSLMEAEANFPGRAATPPPAPPEQPPTAGPTAQEQPTADEVINLTGSPAKTISDSPDTIMDSDDGANVDSGGIGGGGDVGESTMLAVADDDVNLKEFGDLNCAVCGEMVFTATNRLIECSACGTLYHQECHKPPISDEEASEGQAPAWQCDSCLSKPSTSKAAGIIIDEPISLVSKTKSSATSSRSSSTSNSSSPFPLLQQDAPSSISSVAVEGATIATAPAPTSSSSSSNSTTTSRHHHHHHKSSRSHKDDRPSSSSSKSGSSSSAINPTFNVVSASERSSSHSTKKSSSHSSSSKSSSSKSSSKHHDGSKRKGK